jgi:tetratricopeptide (TPR) repeat protein
VRAVESGNDRSRTRPCQGCVHADSKLLAGIPAAASKVGDTMGAQGNFPDALKFLRDGLAVVDRPAKADRYNATWSYDFGILNERIGTSLAIQGDLDGAMRFYHAKLAIVERLARSDRSHTLWQRDLSLSYNKIGDVLVAQGNVREALKYFRDGLAIREQLVHTAPSNALWQRDLLISWFKIAEAMTKGGDYAHARVEVTRTVIKAQSLVQKFPDVPQFSIDLQMVQNLRSNIERAQGR